MNKAYKPLLVVGVAIVIMILLSLRQSGSGAEIIPWRESYSAAKAEAGAANRPLLVYFTATWCGPCQSMKSTTWNDESVKAALNSYVPVKVDVDSNKDLAGQFHIDSIPHFFVIDGTGKTVREISGAMNGSEFVAWLHGS